MSLANSKIDTTQLNGDDLDVWNLLLNAEADWKRDRINIANKKTKPENDDLLAEVLIIRDDLKRDRNELSNHYTDLGNPNLQDEAIRHAFFIMSLEEQIVKNVERLKEIEEIYMNAKAHDEVKKDAKTGFWSKVRRLFKR
jgi:hypothetical protein